MPPWFLGLISEGVIRCGWRCWPQPLPPSLWFRFGLDVPNTDLALAMVVVVAVVVLPGWRSAALVAGISAGVWFDFFLTKPYQSFSIHQSSDVQTTVLLAVVGVVVGDIAARRRVARSDTRTARDEVISLYVITEMLAAGSKADEVVTLIAEQLHDLLFLVDCRFDLTAGTTRARCWTARASFNTAA